MKTCIDIHYPKPIYVNWDSNNNLIATYYLPSFTSSSIKILGTLTLKPDNTKTEIITSDVTPKLPVSIDGVYGNLYGDTQNLNSDISVKEVDLNSSSLKSQSTNDLLVNYRYESIGHYLSYAKISIGNLFTNNDFRNLFYLLSILLLSFILISYLFIRRLKKIRIIKHNSKIIVKSKKKR